MTNVDVIAKNVMCHVCEKKYIWNPSTCNFENGKYLASIMDDSAITCDQIIESYDDETKTISTNFNVKKQPVKCKISIFYLHFYTIALLIAVSINCFLIKKSSKTKACITILRHK